MGWFETLTAVIVGGSALGATIAGFFSWRNKARNDLLRESNSDYKERNAQLEAEIERLKAEKVELKERITTMEREKRLPLERVTKMLAKQHREQMTIMGQAVSKIGEVVEHLKVDGGRA